MARWWFTGQLLIDINESRLHFRAGIVFHGGMTAHTVLFCTYKILVVVYTAQAAYILYDEKCREHGCIHFAYGEFWEVPGAWLHTFYMMKSASSLYKMTVRGSCTKIVWRFSSISYCCFGVKYSSTVLYSTGISTVQLYIYSCIGTAVLVLEAGLLEPGVGSLLACQL